MNIEPLESRIAPAVLINPANPKMASYIDVDGDKVTITTSLGAFTAGNFMSVARGTVGGEQLLLIDLHNGGFDKANLTVSVVKVTGGDGLANVGYINSTNHDLGSVTVPGDLGQIDAGDADWDTLGLKALTIRSLGQYDRGTQAAGGSLESDILGPAGPLTVKTDIYKANFYVAAADKGDLGPVIIGGSIIGGSAQNSGQIQATGDIGPVTIGGDIVGGGDYLSGALYAGGKIASVKVGGSVFGGVGQGAGAIFVGSAGPITVTGDLIGGLGNQSGIVRSSTSLGNVTVKGSIIGSEGTLSGGIFTDNDGNIGAVKIGRSLIGGSGNESGKIDSSGKITSVTVGKSVIGGVGNFNTIMDTNGVYHTGRIFAVAEIGPVKIGGDLAAGVGAFSGNVFSPGKVGSVTVGGSLVAGGINSGAALGAVSIGGDVKDALVISGGIVGGNLTSVTIGGSVFDSGISSNNDLGPVKIGGNVVGGAIGAEQELASVSIAGSLVGGASSGTGVILAENIGTIHIGGDLLGGSIGSGAATLFLTGAISSQHRIGSLFIGGSIIAGSDGSIAGDLSQNATIRAGDDIGTLTVGGDILGTVGSDGLTFATISARGHAVKTTTDIAIGALTVGGRVELANIFAGYDTSLAPKNADAQVGLVTVGGDWITSNLIAGSMNLGADDTAGGSHANADNLSFADSHDVKIPDLNEAAQIFSRIAGITIAGRAYSAASSFGGEATSFGFVAEHIVSVKVGGSTFALNPQRNNDGFALPPTARLSVHEIGSGFFGSIAGDAAKLVNANTVTYTDIDGDLVTVKLSAPVLTMGNVNNVFHFDAGGVGGLSQRQQLQVLDLTPLSTSGLSVTFTVVPVVGSDRLVNLGNLKATGLDLGTITLPGDLGKIDAGSGSSFSPAIQALNVRSIGRLGVDTQPAASATYPASSISTISGKLFALNVQRDIAGASLGIDGSVGSVTVGGSLLGGTVASSGSIEVTGEIGVVKIGGDIIGGTKTRTGSLRAGGIIESVDIGGSVIGRGGAVSGSIFSTGSIGTLKIGGSFIGGTGEGSGEIETESAFANITIGGSVLGGSGDNGSAFIASNADAGAIRIGGDLVGRNTELSGSVHIFGNLPSFTVGGSVVGGIGVGSGRILFTGDAGPVTIGRNVFGGDGATSGQIVGEAWLDSVKIGGSVFGGTQSEAGRIFGKTKLGPVSIGGNVIGGTMGAAAQIGSDAGVGNVTIGGALIGGGFKGAGLIYSGGSVGAVKIGTDLIGGTGTFTGGVDALGSVTSFSVGGSFVGGSRSHTGYVTADSLGTVAIGRNLVGSSINGTTANLDFTASIISTHRIGTTIIGGSMLVGIDLSTGGDLTQNATLRAGDDLGAFTVNGSLYGRPEELGFNDVVIIARGQPVPAPTPDFAIKSITVGKRVQFASIFGGVDSAFAFVNNNAAIGAVKVGGAWIASDLQTKDRITSIAIKGIVAGNSGTGLDNFVFSGRQIGSFKSFGYIAPLTAAPNQTFDLSPTTVDVQIYETP